MYGCYSYGAVEFGGNGIFKSILRRIYLAIKNPFTEKRNLFSKMNNPFAKKFNTLIEKTNPYTPKNLV